ncbi:hypothetical protein UVI_02051530 [Ustilaginoidea virens]|uniref:Rhodopsin domain-containing protein n=1 Tax=Ustilaginoidea virens TaxID=1159556 RepID=A0A1B5KXZ6_USTVR|nr:hypothetical protein UVI_02051530 [Ustilaginoidea virens]
MPRTDAWTLTPDQLTSFGLWLYIAEAEYLVEAIIVKLVFIFFYMRIFRAPGVQRLLWGTVVLVSVAGVVFVSVVIFQCTPIQYLWVRWDGLHQGRCLDMSMVAWTSAGLNIVLDGWMLAIPMSQLRTLNLDWRRKLGVGLMFGIGAM